MYCCLLETLTCTPFVWMSFATIATSTKKKNSGPMNVWDSLYALISQVRIGTHSMALSNEFSLVWYMIMGKVSSNPGT